MGTMLSFRGIAVRSSSPDAHFMEDPALPLFTLGPLTPALGHLCIGPRHSDSALVDQGTGGGGLLSP